MLAVLAASQQQQPTGAASSSASGSTFCTQQTASSSSSRKAALLAPPPPPAPHIPTPDAGGKVENYAELYPDIGFQSSIMLVKSSDTVEDHLGDALGGGFAYFLDERDAEWLEKSNKSATGGPGDVSGTPRARSAKARGKEPETASSTAISEDDFELVMGLFERVTEEKFPYLHLVRMRVDRWSRLTADDPYPCRPPQSFLPSPTTKPFSPPHSPAITFHLMLSLHLSQHPPCFTVMPVPSTHGGGNASSNVVAGGSFLSST